MEEYATIYDDYMPDDNNNVNDNENNEEDENNNVNDNENKSNSELSICSDDEYQKNLKRICDVCMNADLNGFYKLMSEGVYLILEPNERTRMERSLPNKDRFWCAAMNAALRSCNVDFIKFICMTGYYGDMGKFLRDVICMNEYDSKYDDFIKECLNMFPKNITYHIDDLLTPFLNDCKNSLINTVVSLYLNTSPNKYLWLSISYKQERFAPILEDLNIKYKETYDDDYQFTQLLKNLRDRISIRQKNIITLLKRKITLCDLGIMQHICCFVGYADVYYPKDVFIGAVYDEIEYDRREFESI